MSELYHHGIDGQRWGKRNGPPYPLKPENHSKLEKMSNDDIRAAINRKRLENRYNELSTKSTNKNLVKATLKTTGTIARTAAVAGGATGKQNVQDVGRTAAIVSKNSGNIVDDFDRLATKHSKKMDLSKMTDKQLKDEVDRLILEKDYKDLFEGKNKREKVTDMINDIGTAVAVVGTAVSIGLQIKYYYDKKKQLVG